MRRRAGESILGFLLCGKEPDMIGAVFTICSLDNKFVEDSDAYKAVKEIHGEHVASAFTWEYICEFGSDELKEAAMIVTGGIAPGGVNR